MTRSTHDNDVVIELDIPGIDTAAEPREQPLTPPEQEPLSRFRRRLERFKGLSDGDLAAGSLDDESELKLQVMLLREENARLKAARYQPSSPGTAIDRVRLLASPESDGELLDDAWALLSDCLTIREGLDQAAAEVQAAMTAVRNRLSMLTVSIESAARGVEPGADAAGRISA
jgi:hypothetical protein